MPQHAMHTCLMWQANALENMLGAIDFYYFFLEISLTLSNKSKIYLLQPMGIVLLPKE